MILGRKQSRGLITDENGKPVLDLLLDNSDAWVYDSPPYNYVTKGRYETFRKLRKSMGYTEPLFKEEKVDPPHQGRWAF